MALAAPPLALKRRGFTIAFITKTLSSFCTTNA
jgi:hypothetical protein